MKDVLGMNHDEMSAVSYDNNFLFMDGEIGGKGFSPPDFAVTP